jgi:hypothetical protein
MQLAQGLLQHDGELAPQRRDVRAQQAELVGMPVSWRMAARMWRPAATRSSRTPSKSRNDSSML